MLSSNAKGKLLDSLPFVAPQRFVTSSLVQTLTYIDNFLPGTELVHTTTSPHAATLRPMIKGVRVLTLPYLEFEYCNVYSGTYGKSLPLIRRHPGAIVILWNKGDHDHVFFLTMSQLLPCLKDMQANSWSMIVFWNETKGSVARTGPDVGLDFTDQPAPAPDMPPQPPAGKDEVDRPGYDDPHGDMPVDDEDMPPPHGQHPEPDLDDDPIELDTGGDPPSQPPGGGAQVPVPGGEHDDSDLDMPLDPDDAGDNPVHRDPDLGTGHRQISRCFLWSITKRTLLREVCLVLSVRFLLPIRMLSPPMPWPAPSAPIVPVPIPPHPRFPVPQSLRAPSPRNVSQTRARGVHPDGLSKAKSRTVGPLVVVLPGQSAGKKDPILRVTSRLILSLLPCGLVQLRFLVCLWLRGNFLFSKPHARNPPRNLLCRRRRKIQTLTPLLTIVSVKIACLPWLTVMTTFWSIFRRVSKFLRLCRWMLCVVVDQAGKSQGRDADAGNAAQICK